MNDFLRALEVQRWDDHRYYHHSRINQSLHFLSALSFLCCLRAAVHRPGAAALVGWLVAMVSRQVGHFFFEPKGYDEVNQATHEYKEAVKVGYNLRRKVVLLSIWALSPLLLYFDPTLFGLLRRPADSDRVRAATWRWSGSRSASAGCCFAPCSCSSCRTCRPVWCGSTKILTDPFHDIKLYHRAPLYLLRGELIDPMTHVAEHDVGDLRA